MTLTNLQNRASAGEMSRANLHTFTLTTTVDTYEVIGTIPVTGLPGVQNYIAVTTNNLLFKFEYTRNGITWITAIEDYPIAAAAAMTLTAIRNALYYRVSVKPAAAGVHGSCTWQVVTTDVILPPEYRSAFDYESIPVTNAAAVAFTTATMDGATRANITVEDNPIRVRWDGVAPTVSEGHLLQAGDSMVMDYTADMWHFRAIATGAAAKIKVTYSR